MNCAQAICTADILEMVCFALPSFSLVLSAFIQKKKWINTLYYLFDGILFIL